MTERPADDAPTIGETMNQDLYLDPGFTQDRATMVDAVRKEQDETVQRAQAALDDRRADEAADSVEGVPGFTLEQPSMVDEARAEQDAAVEQSTDQA
jgi:hypothetical protein